MSFAWIILAVVALQRLIELPYATRNARALMARGGIEYGANHYPLFILLHGGWLIAMALAIPQTPDINWGFLAAYICLQGFRLWILLSLGPYWTTRVISVPGDPLIARGPYRFMRHPNYWLVAAEIAILPLVFGEWQVALIFSILNAGLVAWRIRVEDRALAPRRS